MEGAAVKAWRLLALLLFSLLARAELQPASSVMLPPMMPTPRAEPWSAAEVRVGVPEQNSAPWSMRIGDRIWGIDADYLSALSQLTGIHFSLRGYASEAQLVAALTQGEVDMVLTQQHHALPENLVLSNSWYSSPIRIYRNRDNQRAVMFNSQNAQLTIAASTLAQLPPQQADKHRWHALPGNLQALYSLLNQQSDYLVADEASAGFLLNQLQQGQIYEITADPGAGEVSLRAVARDPALIHWLDQQLRLLPAEFSLRVQQRWSPALPRYQDTQTLMLTPGEKQWLAQHTDIPFAAEADNAPWSYRDAHGNARGFGIDLLNVLSQSTGLRFIPRWVANPQQAATLLQHQEVMFSLMQPLYDNAGDSATLSVWRAIWGIYTPVAQQPMNWQALAGKRVGILRGDLAQQVLPAGITPQRFSDRDQLWQALYNGQLDAVMDNVLSARWRMASRADSPAHLAFAVSDIAWPMAMPVSDAQPQLRSLLDRALQQIPPETLNQLRLSWSQPPQPGTRMSMRAIPLMVLIAAGIIILLLLILLLRRYLQQRRERLQREQAERANAAKSQFLAAASHELRTPMQAILGLLELEQQQHPNERLALMHSSARSLMALLNDLQDHARIENQSFRLAPRPLDLRRWLTQQQQFYHPLMRESGPVLKVEALTPLPERVLLDGDRLQQVVNNLVANALKFTRHGEVRLSLAVTDAICLNVVDSGSGIPLAEQARLFEPWYQAPSGRSHAVQGSGLGLFICREIVQRMGGSLQLTSTPGQGTRVAMQLPLVLSDAPLSAPPPTWPRYSQLRVAVVDDHPTNLLVMQQQLAAFGIEAVLFEEGRALLKADAAHPFDVLLIDQMMPHPNGWTLLRILRRRERTRVHPTLRILCSADVQLLKKPLQANEALLLKPIALQPLADLLARAAEDPLHNLAQNLLALSQHNTAFLPRVCQSLQQVLQQDCDTLAQAWAQHDWTTLASAAHRLKGSWLMLGLETMAARCQHIADQAHAQQIDGDALNLLLSTTHKLLQQLERYGTHSLSQRT